VGGLHGHAEAHGLGFLDVVWVDDLCVFDAEAVVCVSEGGAGGVGEDGVECLDCKTVC